MIKMNMISTWLCYEIKK